MVSAATNDFAWGALICFCALGVAILTVQVLSARRGKEAAQAHTAGEAEATAPDRSPIWAVVLLFCSYAVLVPGLVYTVFSYNISALNGIMEINKGVETVSGFSRYLARSGSWMGAVAVVLYAMVIPALKLLLFLAGEVLRRGTPDHVRWARRCIIILQLISKWASPDIFAYVLLVYLIRGLSHPPVLVGTAELDIGFACFAIFCVASTIAALGIRVPATGDEGREVARTGRGTCIGGVPALLPTAVLFVLFTTLLCVGVAAPCMALRLDLNPLYAPHGPLDPALKPIIDSLDLPKLTRNDVSVWKCLGSLARWASEGDANGFVALTLFAVMVVGFTMLDMIALLIAAWQLRGQGTTESDDAQRSWGPRQVLAASRVLKKLSMLDVAVTGITVVVICGTVYRSRGLMLSFRWGLLVLLAAELCHYAASHVVNSSVGNCGGGGAEVAPECQDAREATCSTDSV